MVGIFNKKDCNNCDECNIKSPIFSILNSKDSEFLNFDRYSVSYKPGELIYKQGSSYTHLINLTSGLVKLYLEGNQKELITRICKPFEIIGGSGVYIDNKHHNSAAAITEVNACFVDVKRFKEIIRKNALFAEEYIKIISERRLYSFERLGSVMQKQMPGIVAEAIIYLSEKIFDSARFDIQLSRQELANYCGITKEGLIRTMKEFKDEKLITLEGNILEILDGKTLHKISALG